MVSKQERYAQLDARKAYRNVWRTPLNRACCEAPGYCLFAGVCSYCASYSLRKRALYGDMSRYVCCGGYCPCSGRMGEQSCPEFCLCLEVFVCFAQSVASTRFMIQDELRVQTTPCDNCLIGTMFALQQLACICSIVACISGNDEIAQLANCIDLISDVFWCTVCACMQTQHKLELDRRDGKDAPQLGVMQPPPMQQMQRY
eukprot:jgi/Chlat1/2897/Chrsp2S04660